MIVVLVTFALLGGLLALVILTGIGAHRRGQAMPWALLAGLFFPVTWVVWYLRDEHHDRHPAGRSSPC